MKITKKATYKITFAVDYFEATEGGMDYYQYGKNVNTLEEAIHLLELAKTDRMEGDRDWIITCNVEKAISGKEK